MLYNGNHSLAQLKRFEVWTCSALFLLDKAALFILCFEREASLLIHAMTVPTNLLLRSIVFSTFAIVDKLLTRVFFVELLLLDLQSGLYPRKLHILFRILNSSQLNE